MKRNRRLNVTNVIYNHVKNNKKEYCLVALLFVIGIFLGVMFINNTGEAQISEISSYLTSYIDKLKSTESLENMKILKISIIDNIILAVTLCFFGTTVIRNTNCIWNNII